MASGHRTINRELEKEIRVRTRGESKVESNELASRWRDPGENLRLSRSSFYDTSQPQHRPDPRS